MPRDIIAWALAQEANEKTKDAVKVGTSEAGTVPVSDGNNGYTWEKPSDAIKGSDIDTGNAIKILGINEDGDVIKADVPTGTVTVDTEMSKESTNPVQNKVITEELDKIIDGRTPVAKSQMASQLENVSENSGSTQETPFIFQGTGTENNTTATPTAPKGKNLEKQGNSVVVNQKFNKSKILSSGSGTGYSWVKNADNSITITVTDTIQQDTSIVLTSNVDNAYAKVPVGHRFFYTTHNPNPNICFGDSFSGINYTRGTGTYVKGNGTENILVSVILKTGLTAGTYKVDTDIIDLTQWFNGNIPQDLLDHPESWINYFNGDLSFNAGTLENSNGRYLETIEFNQWDEEWEESINRVASKNMIRVIPNAQYYFYSGTNSNINIIWFYDNDGNEVSSLSNVNRNTYITIPSNSCYMKFRMGSAYGTTYNHDICINLHWDGERDGEYKPFVKHIYDTGTEDLGKWDKKIPSGEITHGGKTDDLAELTWIYYSGATCWYAPLSVKDKGSSISNTYTTTTKVYNELNIGELTTYWSAFGSVARIFVNNGSDSISPSGNLRYELATPTTEQGTPFDEVIDVDDYGTMAWRDTNNDLVSVPQGCKIFYPADYSLVIDDLNNYVNGDVTNLALKSDVTTEETARTNQDTILQNAIGGTLRQCLSVKESLDFDNTIVVDLGNLTWTYVGTYGTATHVFIAYSTNVKGVATGSVAKAICTKYKMKSTDGLYYSNSNAIAILEATPNAIRINDVSYTDATEFKVSLKGVLLACEKA